MKKQHPNTLLLYKEASFTIVAILPLSTEIIIGAENKQNGQSYSRYHDKHFGADINEVAREG